VSLDTRQAFRYEELALPKLRHVVTTEHWLSYNPTAYRATGIEAQRAAQQSIATGSRRFAQSAEQFFDYATIVNPARMFGVHGVPFFKSLMLTADGLEHGKEVFAHLEEARSGTRRLIRLREEVKSNRDAPPNLITETVFDSDAGNNPVWYEQTDGKGLGTERFRWHYVQAEGISIPSVYHHQKYDVRTGDLEFEREIKLLDSKVNGQLDRARFSLAALGLPDGDRVDDEIEGRIFEYRNGALVEPGEKTIDASLRSVAIGKDKEPEDDDEKSGLSTGRYLSLIGNFAFLVAILAVCWFVARRRPRGQR
jgi:hypothetical protein